HGGPYVGPGGKLPCHAFRPLVEDLAGGELLSPGLIGVCLLEGVHQEGERVAGVVPFLGELAPLGDQARHGARHEQDHGRRGRDRGPVPAYEFTRPVAYRVGTGGDGEVLEVFLQVPRERRDRAVPTLGRSGSCSQMACSSWYDRSSEVW